MRKKKKSDVCYGEPLGSTAAASWKKKSTLSTNQSNDLLSLVL